MVASVLLLIQLMHMAHSHRSETYAVPSIVLTGRRLYMPDMTESWRLSCLWGAGDSVDVLFALPSSTPTCRRHTITRLWLTQCRSRYEPDQSSRSVTASRTTWHGDVSCFTAVRVDVLHWLRFPWRISWAAWKYFYRTSHLGCGVQNNRLLCVSATTPLRFDARMAMNCR